MQQTNAQGTVNTAATILSWAIGFAVAAAAVIGLKKTHDIGKDKRTVDDAAARMRASGQEALGNNQGAAETRTVNAMANTKKGAEIVSERVAGVAGTLFAASKHACEEAKQVVEEKVEHMRHS